MLEKFADMELQYQGETIWVPETKLGTYIGSGTGTVTGEALSGSVTWSLFENQAPDVCDFTLVGTIREAGGVDGEADGSGGEQAFEILGYSEHEPDTRTWRLSAGIRFTGVKARAAFPAVGIVTGVFDSESQAHHYELFRNSP
ncbi:MAG: hypothetical protein HOL07_04395 [Rhodospirillaceae bacterium]|jgi:hypothetical protein|nr:hypothetical protein [Rhodospirillaceae bacterium]MBT3807885.1 hypothetical protein [Rhodospirillaceae bacterium]MBT4773777.1 hypothetical protein [Rhodospirillaceae bacterium]MBT5357567.1 hypothetical protein [Rhodospirillaceae bacterium]MBT5770556.1 hypothetical protein [Rhodospirillaceae bacterium]